MTPTAPPSAPPPYGPDPIPQVCLSFSIFISRQLLALLWRSSALPRAEVNQSLSRLALLRARSLCGSDVT